MAWARVQSNGHTITATATTLATTLGSAPTTGNKIIVAVGWSGGAALTITCKDGNAVSLTQLANIRNATGADSTTLFAYDVPATPSSTFTATFSSAAEGAIVAQEISGLLAGNTSAMLDGTAATSSGSVTGAGATTSPTYSSTAASEFLLTVLGDFGNAATMVAPAGYALDANAQNTETSANCCVAFKNSTSGAETSAWTSSNSWGGSADQYAQITVAFKIAAGGGGGAAPAAVQHQLMGMGVGC